MANMKVVSARTLVTGKASKRGGEVERIEHAPGDVVSLPAEEAEALIARGLAWAAPAAPKARATPSGRDDEGEAGSDDVEGEAGSGSGDGEAEAGSGGAA
ncbi:hypothetical protein SAMN05444336_112115 [Albimonas donghaensis]|uniref:Uncharacterized protein n=1 Tax=Albimonas donghaensis TaxID=356660 RepID=A0A1H3FJH0_9RHOB|nr:hypothetical protein [Albimonas donghaensis]SDX90294.1 hypothetical protein SAMN05444336_112115 [Albimonas donghaensis]